MHFSQINLDDAAELRLTSCVACATTISCRTHCAPRAAFFPFIHSFISIWYAMQILHILQWFGWTDFFLFNAISVFLVHSLSVTTANGNMSAVAIHHSFDKPNSKSKSKFKPSFWAISFVFQQGQGRTNKWTYWLTSTPLLVKEMWHALLAQQCSPTDSSQMWSQFSQSINSWSSSIFRVKSALKIALTKGWWR